MRTGKLVLLYRKCRPLAEIAGGFFCMSAISALLKDDVAHFFHYNIGEKTDGKNGNGVIGIEDSRFARQLKRGRKHRAVDQFGFAGNPSYKHSFERKGDSSHSRSKA